MKTVPEEICTSLNFITLMLQEIGEIKHKNIHNQELISIQF